MRDLIAAEFGEHYGDGRIDRRDVPLDVLRRIGTLRAEALERRDQRRRCLTIGWKCHCVDDMVDHEGPEAIELAASFFAWAQENPAGATAAISALEFVQAHAPALFPDELEAAAARVIAYLDGQNDA